MGRGRVFGVSSCLCAGGWAVLTQKNTTPPILAETSAPVGLCHRILGFWEWLCDSFVPKSVKCGLHVVSDTAFVGKGMAELGNL